MPGTIRNEPMRLAIRTPVSLCLAVALTVAEAAPAASPRTTARPTAPVSARSVERVRVAAAGDIACERDPAASGPSCRYDDTSDLVVGQGYARILLLGDNQYDRGTLRAYRTSFDPTWGRAFRRLAPSPGNHEYAQDPTSRPRGYFRYFGKRAKGPDGLGYYSFDLGACPDAPCWHVISLSSELCFGPGGCDAPEDPANPRPGERMYAWLLADLAAHPNRRYRCTLAFWHHPRFSFSTGSGATSAVAPLWRALYRARADVVLNGHSHNYQRWRPMDPAGRLDRERGLRQFIVGTGGASHYALQSGPWPSTLAAAQDDAFGVLELSLGPRGYTWRWVGVPGEPRFTDVKRHAVACH
jgi:hypothetical protein